MQYLFHFPLPPDDASVHDANQRHVMLFGAGRGKDEVSKSVKKISKDILKLFNKKFSIDVSEGGKVKKSLKNEMVFETVMQNFQSLSYYDQQTVTHQCGISMLEMLSSFASGTSNYLPVAEHVSFLIDLAGLSLNIQGVLEWSTQILKDLPAIENQLAERGSCLTRNYSTTLALYLVGVLRKYHSIVILNSADVSSIYEQLLRIAYKPKLPSDSSDRKAMLDCNSAEWCILAYVYDLSCSCTFLKSRSKFSELKRLFGPTVKAATSSCILTDRKFGREYIDFPKKQIDPLIIKLLIENPQNQYNLVCNVLIEVCECTDYDKLNDLSIMCSEFSAQCNVLSSMWIGAFAALTNMGGSTGYQDLISEVQMTDPLIYNRLGIFASILIARSCFRLQEFIREVILDSLITALMEVKEGHASRETEIGARLSCHLVLKLFKSVSSFQSSTSLDSSYSSGIKFSCDRHLLSSAQKNTPVAPLICVLKAVLVLGEADKRKKSSSLRKMLEGRDEYGFSANSTQLEDASFSELAKYTLRQICQQEWVHDRCLQVPDDLLKNSTLLDDMLSPKQAQSVLRLICHPKDDHFNDSEDSEGELGRQRQLLTNVTRNLDKWNLRTAAVDIKLMYHRLSSKQNDASESLASSGATGIGAGSASSGGIGMPQDVNSWLDEAAGAVVSIFNLNSPEDAARNNRRQQSSTLLIPYLIKHLKFLQTRVLKVSCALLEESNWSRSSFVKLPSGSESTFMYQSFLQLILTCIQELDTDSKDKKERADREEQKENFLHSLHTQLSTYLCFTKDEKIYNYEDSLARKLMQDALQLRFSLVGAMFDSIYKNQTSTTDWATLMTQYIVRGVVDLTKNSDLFLTVLDMLTTLIHSTLVTDREASQTERSEENRRHYSYHNLIKKLKKEVGDTNNVSVKYVRQLLPFPKLFYEAIACDQFGTVTDAKGNKVKGLNCDKKQGFQLSDKQKINPWDILEGHKNPAPLSWAWFGAIKSEKKVSRYEEAFSELKYSTHGLEKDSPYYLDAPPLPPEDLEPQNKTQKEGEKQASITNQQGYQGGVMNHGMMNHGYMNNQVMMTQNMSTGSNGIPMMPMGRGGYPGMMPMMGGGNQGPMGMRMRMPIGHGGMIGPMNPSQMMPMQQGIGNGMMMPGGPGFGMPRGGPRMHANMISGSMTQPIYGPGMGGPQRPMMGGNMGGNSGGGTGWGGYNMPSHQQHSHMNFSGPGFPQQGNMQPMQQPLTGNAGMQQSVGSSGRYSGGPVGNSKQALQNMLRARHPGPNQFFNQNNPSGTGTGQNNPQFIPPRQSLPMRPSHGNIPPRMQAQSNMFPGTQNNSGATGTGKNSAMGGFPSQQFGGSGQYGFNNQMGVNTNNMSGYMMRQNSGGNYGGQQQMMRGHGMSNISQQGQPNANFVGGNGPGNGNNMGSNPNMYMQNMNMNTALRPGQQQSQQPPLNNPMRMQSQNAISQNSQLMSHLQRGKPQQPQQSGNQMNFSQQPNRY